MKIIVALLALLVPAAAFAAEGGKGPSAELLFAQIIVLIFCGRLLGELMQRIGQPAVIGQLIAGLLLGPSVLGLFWPDAQHALFPDKIEQKAMLDAVAQVGILLLLLLTGMETDLKLVRKVGAPALSISVAGILVPFACGFALGQFLPDTLLPHPEARLITSLFLGTALSISSVKIVAMVVREMHFMRRNVGQIVVSAAITDDTIGWIIIAITFSLAQSGSVEPWSLAKSVLGTIAFLVFSLTLGRRIVFSLIRWANDTFVSEVPVISVIFIIMGVMALITSAIGVHTVLGAFVAGILVGESPILTKKIDEQLRGMITGFFAPVFFGLAGLSADLTVINTWQLAYLTAGLILIASIGKFTGAFIGGKIGGLTGKESFALASGMNARGSTEVIVATIGLSLGMLNESLFTMIVTMAVVTTMAMPPMLRWALSRLPLSEDEKKRLEREEFEARGFVTNLERLLIAVDESNNGKFASRLAGLVAGLRGMPTTVFHLAKGKRDEAKNKKAKSTAKSVQAVAKKAKTGTRRSKDEDEPRDVDVTTRVQNSPTQEAIEEEAKKGYDFLMIGVRNTLTADGAIRNEVNRIASGFNGPLGLVLARNEHEEKPLTSKLDILVAVADTDISNRAAEVAVVLGRTANARVTALYVATENKKDRRFRQATASHRQEEASLKDIVEIGERFGASVRTAVRVATKPDQAILQFAKGGRYDLIVMGVSRRSGEKLFFGNTAQAVLEKAPCSVLLLAADSVSEKTPGPKAELK
ncbi:MAG TPA: cation:proton antiporter [Xanthobacteraceae bacterium]|jgi:Kef-type K+ transport system membrane component KefB/nucleotide-binding universal stress UspA family protein|nr:cation:proton antiporter [Xanthobacteraceae bacterium]